MEKGMFSRTESDETRKRSDPKKQILLLGKNTNKIGSFEAKVIRKERRNY